MLCFTALRSNESISFAKLQLKFNNNLAKSPHFRHLIAQTKKKNYVFNEIIENANVRAHLTNDFGTNARFCPRRALYNIFMKVFNPIPTKISILSSFWDSQ